MTQMLGAGTFSQGAGASASKASVLNPTAWRYLWLHADVANQSAINVWVGAPPPNRNPDFAIGPGQQYEYDAGDVAARSFWVQSADTSAWSGQYAYDVAPVGIDANTVGATTPLQPARTLTTYQTTNNVNVSTPDIAIPAGMQSILVAYPGGSSGPSVLEIVGSQSGRIFPCLAMPGSRPTVSAYLFLVPAGGADTSFVVTHGESDGAGPQTVYVDAVFTPVIQNVIAAQGIGPEADGSWLVTVEAPPGGLPVAPQGGAVFPTSRTPEAGKKTLLTAVSLAAGMTQQLIAGVANQVITVDSVSWQSLAVAGLQQLVLESADGATAVDQQMATATTSPPYLMDDPVPLPSGVALRARAPAGNTNTVSGWMVIRYRQA